MSELLVSAALVANTLLFFYNDASSNSSGDTYFIERRADHWALFSSLHAFRTGPFRTFPHSQTTLRKAPPASNIHSVFGSTIDSSILGHLPKCSLFTLVYVAHYLIHRYSISSFKTKGKPKYSYTAAAKTFLPTLTLNKLTAQINVNSDHPIHENARSAVEILHSSFDTSAPQSPRFLNSCPYSSQYQESGREGDAQCSKPRRRDTGSTATAHRQLRRRTMRLYHSRRGSSSHYRSETRKRGREGEDARYGDPDNAHRAGDQ